MLPFGAGVIRHLEPQLLRGYAERFRPLDKSVQVPDWRTVLDATELGLCQTCPRRNGFLRDHLAAVPGMGTERSDDLAHVAPAERIADRRVLPELWRNDRHPCRVAPAPELTGRALASRVVARQQRTAQALACRAVNLPHGDNLVSLSRG